MAEFFQPTTQLYVGNLPWSTTEGELSDLFASFSVTSLTIPTGREGRSRGYAIVDFESKEQADLATQTMDGHLVGERALTVRESKARPERPAAGPSRGGRSATGLGEVPAGGSRCYVGNLSWDTTSDSLIAHCSSFSIGVVACEVAEHNGRSKGWALVDFASAEEAANAIQVLHDTELDSRAIIIRPERAAKPAGNSIRVVGGGAGGNARAPRPDPRPENSSGLQIVVRSLPWATTNDDLLEVFQQIGNVISCNVQCHEDTGRSKGWATVRFETQEQAQAAIDGFNGVALGDRPMQVKFDRYE